MMSPVYMENLQNEIGGYSSKMSVDNAIRSLGGESVDNAYPNGANAYPNVDTRSLGGGPVDNAYPNGANIYPNVDTRSLVNEAQDNAMKALGD